MPPAPGDPTVLALSIIALFLGPLLYQWLRRGGRVARTVETAIVAVLVVLVVFLLVPESLEALGPWALALMAAGYLLPGLLEIAVRRAAHAFHVISLFLALAGLALHAMLDGAGLAGSRGGSGEGLALAIILHRFGVGLVLWFMVQPVFGRRVAVGVLVGVSAATLAGYWLSDALVRFEEPDFLHVVQALIVGTILHSLVHRGHAHTHPESAPDHLTGD
jgi:hypothetical protein